jgi:hypothetical protein
MGKMRDKMAAVKKQLHDKQPQVKIDPKVALAMSLGFAYEKVLGEYIHQPSLRFFKKIGTDGITPQTMGFLCKAASIAEHHEVDVETYVRAQFYWFHQWFRRPPKVRELCSVKGKFPATRRLTEYLKLTRDKRVFSVELPSGKLGHEELDRINRERLEELVETWGKTHTEILEMFAPAGVFDVEWLAQHPIWQRLAHKGKL